MNEKTKSLYLYYIAAGLRYIRKQTKLELPRDMIIIAQSYCPLAEINHIMDIPIYIMNMSSPYDFHIAFKNNTKETYELLRAFDDYLNDTVMRIS